MDTAIEIKGFLEEYLQRLGKSSVVNEKTNLLSNSDLDSLLVIELTLFIEKKFNLDFRQQPLERVHFSTLGSLIKFVDEATAGPS